MARVLIVGCGCRGRELAAALGEDGHAVRGTSRSEQGKAAIEAAGHEAALADPDRLGTLLAPLDGVSAVAWLLGSASGEDEAVAALHGPRLESILDRLVETPVRGLVYEAAGTLPAGLLAGGAALARAAAETYPMPTRVVDADPGDRGLWTAAMRAAVGEVLSG